MVDSFLTLATDPSPLAPRPSAFASTIIFCLCLALCATSAYAETLLPPQDFQVYDTPSDGGGSLTLTWAPSDYDGPDVQYEIMIDTQYRLAEETVPSPYKQEHGVVPAFPTAAIFPSDTQYVGDGGHPWWTRPAAPDSHYLQLKSRNDLVLVNGQPYAVTLAAVRGPDQAAVQIASVVPAPDLINWAQVNNLMLVLLFSLGLFGCIHAARRAQAANRETFLRRIPGLDAVDEAIGRATELGKPILYLTGAQDMGAPSTLAAAVILGRVSKRVALYETELIVPHRNPIVMAVCQEITKQAYLEAGKPDAYKEDSNFFITDDQFSYTAAVDGIMLRQKPAANFFMGYYYAESLLLTETGASTGAIQIAGTDADHQLPFFVTTCDYTLIGEELYAASAYLSREPVQVGTLRAQDLGKAVILAVLALGTGLATIGVVLDAQWPAYLLDLFRDVK